MRRAAGVVGALVLCGALAFLLIDAVWAPDRPGPKPVVGGPTPTRSTPQPSQTAVPPSPSPTATARLAVDAHTDGRRIRFTLRGRVPSGAREALLWYDAEAGATPLRVPLAGARVISTSLLITPTGGLTVSVPRDLNRLDFWWAVRPKSGAFVRRAGSLSLPPSLAKQPLPPRVPQGFAWQQHRTPHFLFYLAPDSAAARDIKRIEQIAEASYTQASGVISPALIAEEATSVPTFTVYLVPRVFWQGGVAYSGGTLMISYLDRNYADVAPWSYFVHETAHALSRVYAQKGVNIGGMLGEGSAVYATGGHYTVESLRKRAAALRVLGRGSSLCELSREFYELQHEAAYLQAASYVDYLIEHYGLQPFLEHYLHGHMPYARHDEEPQAYCDRLYATVAEPFGVSFKELEAAWLAWLGTQAIAPADSETLSTTLRYYDLMRRYESEHDPAARALPSNPVSGWEQQTLARFLTRAMTPTNVLQEVLLIAGHRALLRGEMARADALLDEVERSLGARRPTGPASEAFAAVQELFAKLARARRLGDTGAYSQLVAADARDRGPPPGLYARYEIDLQQLEISGNSGEGLLHITSRAPGGEQAWQRYRFKVERRDELWQVLVLEPAAVTLERPPGAQMVLGQ